MNEDNPMETIQDIKNFLEFARVKYIEDFKRLDESIAEAKKDNDLARFYTLILAKARQEGGLQFVKVLKQEFINKGGNK